MIDQDSEAGFTLLEVLVGFLLLALALGSLYQSMSTSLSGIRLAREREAIVAHAATELEMARRFASGPIAREGRYGNGSRWRIRSEPMRGIDTSQTPALRPAWLVFEATAPSGQQILSLKTTTVR